MGQSGRAELSSQASELVQVQPDSDSLSRSSSSSTPRALSPVNQVMEEPAPPVSSSTSSSLVGGAGQAPVMAAQPPPPAERMSYGRQQQYMQPLQQQSEDDQDLEDEFDSLNAPYERQIGKRPSIHKKIINKKKFLERFLVKEKKINIPF